MHSRRAAPRTAWLEVALVLATFFLAWRFVHVAAAMPAASAVALLAYRRAGLGARNAGLTRRELNARTLWVAAGLGAVLAAVAWWGLRPACEWLVGSALDLTKLRSATATIGGWITMLAMSWTYAAVGEEWLFRGYVLTRLSADASARGAVIVVASSVVFGLAHAYQGPAGILLTGLVGALLGALFLLRRNLWLNVLTHGVVDTIAMTAFHRGWI